MLGYAQKFLIRDILLHLETHFKQETETSCISDTNFSIQKTQLQLSLHVMEQSSLTVLTLEGGHAQAGMALPSLEPVNVGSNRVHFY